MLTCSVFLMVFCLFQTATSRSLNTTRHRFRRSGGEDECAATVSDLLHVSYSKMVNGRDFSHFHPDEQLLIDFEPRNGHALSAVQSECSLDRRSEKIHSDQPLRERTLCPYHHVLNYNPKRIPSSIVEVSCSCEMIAGLLCQPSFYSMKVLIFDDECNSYVEKIERFQLACLPVIMNQMTVETRILKGKVKSASVETK